MRKFMNIVVLALAVMLVAAGCSSSDSGGSLDGRTIKVAVENAYPPYNFIPEGSTDGEGWDYDAWNEICKRGKCTAEFVEAGWPAVIVETGQGQYDTAADGISITEERKEVVAFSDPYMVIEQKFMVRNDESRFGNTDDFIAGDYRLGTQVGTSNYELGVSLLGGEDRIDAFDQFGVAVQALISGDVDAVIIDDTAGQGYKGANQEAVRLLPESLQSDPLGFIFPQDSDIIEEVNAILKEMQEDGTLDDLAKRWFVDFEG